MPIGVALLVLVGSLARSPRPAPTGAVGGTTDAAIAAPGGRRAGVGADRLRLGGGVDGATTRRCRPLDPAGDGDLSSASAPEGPYLADGTLLKPIAVDTTVDDGREHAAHLQGPVGRHAHRDRPPLRRLDDDPLVGEPPQVEGRPQGRPEARHPAGRRHGPRRQGRRDAGRASPTQTDVSSADIVSFNGLTDQTLVVGQTLILPGRPRRADPHAEAEAAPGRRLRQPAAAAAGSARRGHYGGGAFAWPVAGGYISQYFHYGHSGARHRAAYGSADRRRPPSGTVIFAGWKNNGGGYQVWIAHGSGLYTDLQPHVGDHRRLRRSTSAAGSRSVGSGERLGHRSAPPLRGLARRGLGQRLPGQPARLPLGRPRARPRSASPADAVARGDDRRRCSSTG